MNYDPEKMRFFTIEVKIPNRFAPKNLQDNHWECNADTMITLGVSTSARLTRKRIYLDSRELTESFVDHLHKIFAKRAYCEEYFLFIRDHSHDSSKLKARWKLKHSEEVRVKLKDFKYA